MFGIPRASRKHATLRGEKLVSHKAVPTKRAHSTLPFGAARAPRTTFVRADRWTSDRRSLLESELSSARELLHGSKAEILAAARERARANGIPYEGLLLPAEAAQLLREESDAMLVDVRIARRAGFRRAHPGRRRDRMAELSGMLPNAEFQEQLASRWSKDAPVMFICRSGGRSHDSALTATQAGFKACFNVLEGFEGDRDASGTSQQVGGWRASGLPWMQS